MEAKMSGWLLLAAAACFSMSWLMKRLRGKDYGDYQNLGLGFLALGLFSKFNSIL